MNKIKEWLVTHYPRVQFIFDGHANFLERIGPFGRITWFGSIAVIALVSMFWFPLCDASKEEAKLQNYRDTILNSICGGRWLCNMAFAGRVGPTLLGATNTAKNSVGSSTLRGWRAGRFWHCRLKWVHCLRA